MPKTRAPLSFAREKPAKIMGSLADPALRDRFSTVFSTVVEILGEEPNRALASV
jgi:hypothetical protein